MKKSQRDGPVIAAGVGISILVTILTVFAVMAVVKKLNDDADAALLAAMAYRPVAHAQGTQDGQAPSISGPAGANNQGGSSGTDSPDGNKQIPSGTQPGSTGDEQGSADPSAPGGSNNEGVPGEDTLPVGDGTEGDDTQNGNPVSGDDDESGVTSDEGSESASGNEGQLGDAADGETSDSNNPADVGLADGRDIIGLEYLSIGPDGTAVYHVVWGDTLSAISRKLGFSVDELADYNNIRDINLIYAGTYLRVPLSDDMLALLKSMQNTDDKVHAQVNTGPEDDDD